MTTAATVTWPVYLRVSDLSETKIGEIEADSATEAQRAVAELLRAAADAIELQIGDSG